MTAVKTDAFITHENHIFYRGKLMIYQETETKVLFSLDVRNKVKTDDIEELDKIIFDLRSRSFTIEYKPSLKNHFDVKSQVDAFMSLPDASEIVNYTNRYGLELTSDELMLPITKKQNDDDWTEAQRLYGEAKNKYNAIGGKIGNDIKELTKKFKTRFDAPKLPTALGVIDIDFESLYDDASNVEKADRWLNDPDVYETPYVADNTKSNLVRLNKSGKRIESMSGYYLGVRTAEDLARYCLAYWSGDENAKKPRIRSDNYYDKDFTIRENYIAVGCQRIPRIAIEYISSVMGWDKEKDVAIIPEPITA